MTTISVRFWGVRGSVPAPLTPIQVQEKIADAVFHALRDRELMSQSTYSREAIMRWVAGMDFSARSTYGGNTTCVEVRAGDDLIILDMGTGLRELGLGLMGETFKNGGLRGTILQSHVHWDHIQGYPFWPQVYMPRKLVDNAFSFYGGLDWNRSLEEVLRGQMNAPMFPVEHRELEQTGMRMNFNTVFDGKEISIPHSSGNGDIRILCRKLLHPQETYGYRIEYGGVVVAFCTDHEPYATDVPHRPLVELAKDADIFITDCQYTHDEFAGVGGKVQKMGWGHSFPEYIARVAQEARVKGVLTTHHDPQASDARIEEIARAVHEMSGIPAAPAYEGLHMIVGA